MSPAAHWTPDLGMAALDRARRAWERTAPQLIIDGWLDMLDGLDGLIGARSCPQSTCSGASYPARVVSGESVEPVAPHTTPAAGSTPTNGGTS